MADDEKLWRAARKSIRKRAISAGRESEEHEVICQKRASLA